MLSKLKSALQRIYAFTLIELMIVITIIGIVSTIAIPNFNQYVLDAKISESYVLVGAIKTSQLVYFSENNHFCFTYPFGTHEGAITRTYEEFDDDGISQWNELGKPLPSGDHYFAYKNMAGERNDSDKGDRDLKTCRGNRNTGTDIHNEGPYGRSGRGCPQLGITDETLGADLSTSDPYDWVAIVAITNFNATSTPSDGCYTTVQILESYNNQQPTSSPLIKLSHKQFM